MEAGLTFNLHPGQREVFFHPARFKVVPAGRRWGKTSLARMWLLHEAVQTHKEVDGQKKDLKDIEAWYVAPTYSMAAGIFWRQFKTLAEPVTRRSWSNDLTLELVNGRIVRAKGCDREEALLGPGLSAVVLDEFATTKPIVWEEVLRPTLADVRGKALFIGTPLHNPKNHFYDLWLLAHDAEDWAAFDFETLDNPFIPEEEVEHARQNMPKEAFDRQFRASFESGGGYVLDFPIETVETAPGDGLVFMAVDPAGFQTADEVRKKGEKRDETAIAIVEVGKQGWTILDIVTGRWDVRETSIRILREAQKHRPVLVGIEKGMLRRAMEPYLFDQSARIGVFPRFTDMSAAGRKTGVPIGEQGPGKTNRIAWALQGRLQQGKITAVQGDYLPRLMEQLRDFPNGRHDDMVDALSYIDQISRTIYMEDVITDDLIVMDEAIGW